MHSPVGPHTGAGFRPQAFFYASYFFVVWGFFVSLYYQVCARYVFQKGKPQLASVTFHTTSEYFPYLVPSPSIHLQQSRFFHTVREAEQYISFLFSRYPNTAVQRPILDADQLALF